MVYRGDPPIPHLTIYGLGNGNYHFIHNAVLGQHGGLGNIYQHRFNFFPKNSAFSAWGPVGLRGSRLRVQPMGAATPTHPAPWEAQLWRGRWAFTATHATGSWNEQPGAGHGGPQDWGCHHFFSQDNGVGVLPGNGGTNMNMPVSKPTLWAAIASNQAKLQQKMKAKSEPVIGGALPPPHIKHNMDIGTWVTRGLCPRPQLPSKCHTSSLPLSPR